tara:strand:+ start:800 stop:1783 length:984 start_codon:yes stop_codon:yes gene_type:complete
MKLSTKRIEEIDAISNQVHALKQTKGFEKKSVNELSKMISKGDSNIPLRSYIGISESTRSPMYHWRSLEVKAGSTDITNTVLGKQPSVKTPTTAYNTYRESILFDAVETLAAPNGVIALTALNIVEPATVQANEADAITASGASFEWVPLKLTDVTYLIRMSTQAIADTQALDAYEQAIITEVNKLCATKALEDLKAMAETVTATETAALDKVNEMIKSLPSEVEGRLLVVNKADALTLDKALMALGLESIEDTKTLFGVPVLLSEVANSGVMLITNSALIYRSGNAAIQYGDNADDFSTNQRTLKVLARIKGTKIAAHPVYQISLA